MIFLGEILMIFQFLLHAVLHKLITLVVTGIGQAHHFLQLPSTSVSSPNRLVQLLQYQMGVVEVDSRL